jgi:hypothetical protein
MVDMLRPQPQTRSIVEPQPSAWLLLLRNLQPLATSEALYPMLVNLPAVPLQERRNARVAVAAILAGQLHDGPGEYILVFALCQQIALRAAWLVHQPARSPLTHTLSLSMIQRTAPSPRA